MTENHYHGRTSCAFGRAHEAKTTAEADATLAAAVATERTLTYSDVTAENVADYLLNTFGWGPENIITITRLQGILFRAQAHYLAEYGVPLFPEEFHYREIYPVVPEIEARYRTQANQTQEKYGKYFHCFPVKTNIGFSPDIRRFLLDIWGTYASREETVSGTRVIVGEGEWSSLIFAPGTPGTPISHEAMAGIFPKPYVPLPDWR